MYQQGILKALLEHPELLNPPKSTDGGDKKKKDGDPHPTFSGQSAVLRPDIWDKRSYPDGQADFQLTYMDLDEFLNENDLPMNGELFGESLLKEVIADVVGTGNGMMSPRAQRHGMSPGHDVACHGMSPGHDVARHGMSPARDVTRHRLSPGQDIAHHGMSPGRDIALHGMSPGRDIALHGMSPRHDVTHRALTRLLSDDSPGHPQHIMTSPRRQSTEMDMTQQSLSPLGQPLNMSPRQPSISPPLPGSPRSQAQLPQGLDERNYPEDYQVSPTDLALATIPVYGKKRYSSALSSDQEDASSPYQPHEDTSPSYEPQYLVDDGDLALARMEGQDDFDPCRRKFSVEELRPQPMIKKSRKVYVPEDLKDDRYWCRRKKNNVAAKRSRDARRVKENQIALRASFLESQNKTLRSELETALRENQELMEKLKKYENAAN